MMLQRGCHTGLRFHQSTQTEYLRLGEPRSIPPPCIIRQHIPVCAADANILINKCRLKAQRHRLTYQEAIPVEQLVRSLCDEKQVGFTQGLRWRIPSSSWDS